MISSALEQSHEKGRKTIDADEILEALRLLEYHEFIPLLQDEIQAYEKNVQDKKAYRQLARLSSSLPHDDEDEEVDPDAPPKKKLAVESGGEGGSDHDMTSSDRTRIESESHDDEKVEEEEVEDEEEGEEEEEGEDEEEQGEEEEGDEGEEGEEHAQSVHHIGNSVIVDIDGDNEHASSRESSFSASE